MRCGVGGLIAPDWNPFEVSVLGAIDLLTLPSSVP